MNIKNEVMESYNELEMIFNNVSDVISTRLLVPTGEVYPLFVHLSNTWFHLQSQTSVLIHINKTLSQLNDIDKVTSDDLTSVWDPKLNNC